MFIMRTSGGELMRGRRRPVRKGRSARKFRRDVGRTKAANLAKPGRGGFRL